MGAIMNTCCTMSGGDDDEIKISQLGSLASQGNQSTAKKGPHVQEFPLDDTAKTNDLSAFANSDTTKMSSGAQISS